MVTLTIKAKQLNQRVEGKDDMMATELKLVRTLAEDTLKSAMIEHKKQPAQSAEIMNLRDQAAVIFAKNGLPNKRVEAWKYTDLKQAMSQVANSAPLALKEADVVISKQLHAQSALASVPVHAWIAGGFTLNQPLPHGVKIDVFSPTTHGQWLGKALALAAENAAVQLNNALINDIIVVHVAAGQAVEEPLHLGFVAPWNDAAAVYSRVLVIVEKGASLTLIEHQLSHNGIKHQINSVVEVVIADNASCHHIRLNAHGADALVLSTLGVQLGDHAVLNAHNIVIAPAFSRHQVFTSYHGEHAQANINGVSLLKGKQHADNTLIVDHAQPHGSSREIFKTVLDGAATGVFQGQIQVKAKAQKTDGRMSSNALMLSDECTMYNKPELEIFADDVQCAHGATCGALDDDLLFYLLARGISRKDAEGLMVHAFVGEALEGIEHEDVRNGLSSLIQSWVEGRASA